MQITDDDLDRWSREGDPAADDLIRAEVDRADEITARTVIRDVARHLHVPEERSPAMSAYLGAAEPPSIRVDHDKLDLGARFFADHALEVGSALFCGSLPEGYASPRGARVLMLTGRLAREPVRRIMETAQMVLHVTSPGGLTTGTGFGYQDARRVRLMHAAIRHYITEDPEVARDDDPLAACEGWVGSWGLPLNQADLLGGLLTFTVTVFDALQALGIQPSEDELDAYLHLWCVVTSIMGLHPDLVPANPSEAQLAAKRIRDREQRPSDDGKALTAALVEALQAEVPGPLKGFVPAMVQLYVGDAVAADLGVDASPLFTGPMRWMSSRLHADELRDNRYTRTLVREIGAMAVRGFMNANRSGERPAFDIPKELRSTFGRGPAGFHLPTPGSMFARIGPGRSRS